jgi:hypothetical protein
VGVLVGVAVGAVLGVAVGAVVVGVLLVGRLMVRVGLPPLWSASGEQAHAARAIATAGAIRREACTA